MNKCKIKNSRNEYITDYYYTGYPFSGYEFRFGDIKNALVLDEEKAKKLISQMSYGMVCMNSGDKADRLILSLA